MTTQFPIIHTRRFILRQFSITDLNNVYKGLSHPDVIKYYGIRFNSLDATKEQIEWFANLEENGTGIWWAICTIENEDFCGAIGFNNLERKHNKAEIGFWLLPEFWGKGIITEVMQQVCNYAFNQLLLHRIEAYVDTRNERCKNTLIKFYFAFEGTMNECELEEDKYVSLDIFAYINPADNKKAIV